jgi:chaperonin GroEL (HSP60 family)
LAGDGTTTATVLAQAIVKKVWKTLLQEQINGWNVVSTNGKAIVADLAKQSKVVVQTLTNKTNLFLLITK